MKNLHKNILFQIIIAIVLGIVLGQFASEGIGRVFASFNAIFSSFLSFSIPLIILGLVVPAIGKLGKGAGSLLVLTVAIAYGSTLFAGFSTYFASIYIFPELLATQTHQLDVADKISDLIPYFSIEFTPLMDVMSALVLAFIIGIGISKLNNSTLEQAFDDFLAIITQVINKVIIPLLPLFIFGIFLNMSYTGQVFSIIQVFVKIIGVIFALHILLLLIQFSIAGIIAKKNPFKLLITMMPAYFTALGTQSSAATIPITLQQTLKNGVSEKIAGFVIPLAANIHLAGSTLKIVACAIALMLLQGQPIEFGAFAGFICMLGIAMVAAPGVPGGAIMAAIGIIAKMLGFDAESQALMISLYIAMDSFGTACNVTGDGAIAVVVDALTKKKMTATDA
ncbi:dicarboxylate/amino acid:cation symporter [Flavobacterium sp. JP2137]|uniref:dicarboxylate/amino acid:cation symporter n=1 Tax=Flavobacterium sp. JP2137 TaxID=3414510 RepID=UPI003D2FA01F